MKLKGQFTSIWDGGTEIVTDAVLDTETGEIVTESVDAPVETLDDEYFESDDEIYEVCPDCHTHILKIVMKEAIGKTLYEDKVCTDPDCINQ